MKRVLDAALSAFWGAPVIQHRLPGLLAVSYRERPRAQGHLAKRLPLPRKTVTNLGAVRN